MDRLKRPPKSWLRLIWPSAFLRSEGDRPLAAGPRAIIKHVDDFRPVHNLASLADLTATLARIGPRREEDLTTWHGMAPGLRSLVD